MTYNYALDRHHPYTVYSCNNKTLLHVVILRPDREAVEAIRHLSGARYDKANQRWFCTYSPETRDALKEIVAQAWARLQPGIAANINAGHRDEIRLNTVR